MKLYLIRHATPAIEKYHNLPPGPSLGEKGKAEAQKMASWLSGKKIERVLSSDFVRVLETASPFIESYAPHLEIEIQLALREREASVEAHEHLVTRVHTWLHQNWAHLQAIPHAIFSHCGPINMILEALDPEKHILSYPYQCPYGCLTPKGGIWELDFQDGRLNHGELIAL